VIVSSLSATFPVELYSCYYIGLLLCDDDISPFIDVLEDFHAVDIVELLMVDDHMLMTDYINISAKVIISSGRCSLSSP